MAKRENESQSIKYLLNHLLSEGKLSKGMQKIRVEEVWHALMGAGVSSYTESVILQNKTLIVKLKSAVLREELSYGKEKIIKMINEKMGSELITKLILS